MHVRGRARARARTHTHTHRRLHSPPPPPAPSPSAGPEPARPCRRAARPCRIAAPVPPAAAPGPPTPLPPVFQRGAKGGAFGRGAKGAACGRERRQRRPGRRNFFVPAAAAVALSCLANCAGFEEPGRRPVPEVDRPALCRPNPATPPPPPPPLAGQLEPLRGVCVGGRGPLRMCVCRPLRVAPSLRSESLRVKSGDSRRPSHSAAADPSRPCTSFSSGLARIDAAAAGSRACKGRPAARNGWTDLRPRPTCASASATDASRRSDPPQSSQPRWP